MKASLRNNKNNCLGRQLITLTAANDELKQMLKIFGRETILEDLTLTVRLIL